MGHHQTMIAPLAAPPLEDLLIINRTADVNYTWTSSDNGDTWIGRGASISTLNQAVGYDGTRHISPLISSTSIAYSTNFGTSWTFGAGGVSRFAWYQMAMSPGGIRCFAGASGTILRSTDGTTWTAIATGSGANTGIIWDGTQFVLCCDNTPWFRYSTDGITWTAGANNFYSGSSSSGSYKIFYNGSRYIFCGPNYVSGSSNPGIWYNDGVISGGTWFPISYPYALPISGALCGFDGASKLLYSFDNGFSLSSGYLLSTDAGANGAPHSWPGGLSGVVMNSILYKNATWFAVTDAGEVLKSADAITWTHTFTIDAGGATAPIDLI